MDYKHIIIIASFLLSAVAADSLTNDEVKANLQLLCQDKHVELTRISQVRNIVQLLKLSDDLIPDCPQVTRDSLSRLDSILSEGLDDVCSMEKVEQIQEYHYSFIAKFGVHFANNNNVSIPKSLSNFFIAFGLAVSRVCKKTMINSLILDTENISESDLKLIEVWTNNNNGIVQSLGSGPNDFDDLLLIRDFARYDDNGLDREKIFIQTGSIELLTKIQTTCQRSFKPLYGRLILPLVALSNAGYSYEGEDLQRELSELRNNELVNKWYRITYLCETLEDIELVEDPKDSESVVGFDRSLVRILTKEEANQLREERRVDRERMVDSSSSTISEDSNLNFGVPLGDVVIDHENDKEFDKLINNFDATRKESERTRKRLFARVGRLIKDLLVGGTVKIISSLFKRNGQDGTEGSNKESFYTEQRLSAIQAIDEYVQQVSSSDKNYVDRPVAGLQDYGRRVAHNAKFMVATKGNYPGAEEETKRKKFPVAKVLYRSLIVIVFIVACVVTFG